MSHLLSEVASPASQNRDDDRFAGPGESSSVAVLAESGGIDIECLDASLLQAVSYLFPKDRGRTFVASLLQIAVIKQMDISGVGRVDVAVAVLKSIEAFARQHGHGKDTALRYVDILEALQIVRRYRHADSTELLIPLVAWAPSEQAFSALDALLAESAARAKLQQLAGTVKTRFLLLYGSPHSWSSLFEDLHETLSDVQALLDKRLSISKRSLLQLRIANLKTRLEAEGAKGELWNGQQEAFPGERAEKGDFYTGPGGLHSPAATQKGDFQGKSNQVSPSAAAEKGDFYTGSDSIVTSTPTQKGDLPHQGRAEKGDLYTRPGSQNERNYAEKGDFHGQSGRRAAQKGDFQEVATSTSLNDNVITLSNDISEKEDVNDNDAAAGQDRYTPKEAAAVGRQLAKFLENSPENTGGFVNKAKQYTRTAIRAAVIDTLVHLAFPTIDPADERGRPRNSAGWFHDACKRYGKPGMHIPAFIERWLRTDLSWDDIKQQLDEASSRYKRFMIADAGTADLVRKFLCGEIGQQALDEALQHEASQEMRANQVPTEKSPQPGSQTRSSANGEPSVSEASPAKTWMDEYEAEALAEEILRDAGQQGVTAEARPEHGVYVVDILMQGHRMTMKNAQAWRTHYEKVQRALLLQQQQQQREQGGQHGTSR